MSTLQVTVLSAPALLAAGLASSAHCALMCGALQATPTRKQWWALQAGRISTYTILGAFAGASGAWLIALADTVRVVQELRIVLILALLLSLLFAWRRRATPRCCPRRQRSVTRSAFLRGLLTGLIPCALLYAALALAVLAGSAAQGALLMAAFGLGTVPAVRAGSWGWSRLQSPAMPMRVRGVFTTAAVLAVTLVWWCGAGSVLWCR